MYGDLLGAGHYLYLSIRQCERFGQVSSLGEQLQEGSDVTTPHSVVQPAGICFFPLHDVTTFRVLCQDILLPGIPGCIRECN